MAPISMTGFIVGKTLPYLLLSQISAMLVIVASQILFGLPVRGGWLALSIVLAVFLVGALGTGLLISTLADTQQVAFQVAVLSSYLPTLMLSGFIFPISSMPAALQAITYAVPARYFLRALRAILLKGVGLEMFWRDLVALGVFATLVLALASLRLRREWRLSA
jgi:ABC-2 type transport system permease protein